MEYVSQYQVKTVTNAVSVLRALAKSPHPMSAGELARATGIEYNRVYRIIITFEIEGIFERVLFREIAGVRVGGNPKWIAADGFRDVFALTGWDGLRADVQQEVTA